MLAIAVHVPIQLNMKHTSDKTKKIAAMNDLFRQTFWGGTILLDTNCITQMPQESIDEVFAKIRDFDSFDENNDPFCWHDAGMVRVGIFTIIWRIDCLDPTMQYDSKDASDPNLTHRVLHIFAAEG